MLPGKKQLEILLMHYFRASYPDFPKGRLRPSESPDFVLTLKSFSNLGIELTRLNLLNTMENDTSRQLQNRIIDSARSLFESTSSVKLFVKFLFSEKENIAEARELSVAVQLTNAVREVVENKKNQAFFGEVIAGSRLPAGVDSMLVVRDASLLVSIWENSNSPNHTEDVMADIRKTILKKDEKLRLYQKQRLNFYWLIITVDWLRGLKNDNLPEKIINNVFQSRFQHVFLFDLIKADVFQLV